MFNKKEFLEEINSNLKLNFGKNTTTASEQELYFAVSKSVMALVVDKWEATEKKQEGNKKAYYLSAEFLMGRAFGNNLINLGLYEDVREALEEIGFNLNTIEDKEEDAGLGNGGLGRLAACFIDSSSTLGYPVVGYGIRYEYGMFKQSFEDGFQVEKADQWLKNGDPWSFRREEDIIKVTYKKEVVNAVPYDYPVIGYKNENVNKLRLWKSEPVEPFDIDLFNDQNFNKSVQSKNRAEDISRVLYPNDSSKQGKILRLKQQYFFVSASLQDMVRKYKLTHGTDFSTFSELHAVQLNDTHPVVAIPELMRILMDEENLSYDESWEIVGKTFAYTNHTILSEALEKWSVSLFREILPRIVQIIVMIDKAFVAKLKKDGYSKEKIKEMRIIEDKTIRMAWMAIHGTFATNGVAKLHTDILKNTELKDWYDLYPNRFINKTNGITQRRWLLYCNPELSAFITELLGSEDWVTNLTELKKLEKFGDDKKVLTRFLEIKNIKKEQLKKYVKEHDGVDIDTNSVFDIQIKRLHEYKRQLLNAFNILDLYYRLKENPDMDIVPRTFIFGAKSAPGYFRAKGVIKFINEIAKMIENDADVNEKIKVLFVENYRVSYAEYLFPAADVSEQISTTGKEASGTGNMKFMLNGAPTLGTLDGANVEIVNEAGIENNFIFGLTIEELDKIRDDYNPLKYYNSVEGLKRVVDSLIDGTFDDGGTGMFKELHDSILKGAHWHVPDVYFLMKDFDDYRKAQDEVDKAYRDQLGWAKKCWMNISNAGTFSSDRTIEEYATEIWNIKKVK